MGKNFSALYRNLWELGIVPVFILRPEIAERAEGPQGDLRIYFGFRYWKGVTQGLTVTRLNHTCLVFSRRISATLYFLKKSQDTEDISCRLRGLRPDECIILSCTP